MKLSHESTASHSPEIPPRDFEEGFLQEADQAQVPNPRPKPRLTEENYTQGFLVDEELMAGITPIQKPRQSQAIEGTVEKNSSQTQENPLENAPTGFIAFVLRHTTGEYLGFETYSELTQALSVINAIPRSWSFEKINSGCGGGKCGAGKCAGSKCKNFSCCSGSETTVSEGSSSDRTP